VRALVMLMLFTALRISETVALDVDDVRILTRKGVLVVIGKREVQREVPLNALVRQVLDEWLDERKDSPPRANRRYSSAAPAAGCPLARPIATCGSSPPARASNCRRTRCATPV
jgi:site-specific recombinase XerC